VSNETTVSSHSAAPLPPGGPHPTRIGPYRIVRVLGQGGMGLVYEAEQLEPFHRMVALKVIRRGMDTHEVLARFESERQALAVMAHPNIAKALDAGTTEEGLPYFVMELVAGEPLTGYCDRHQLDLRHRLELFIAVCKGVQHAHQKGVIHRDLKPSNILVRVTDGQPVPTIIDFGIAKATEQRLTSSEFTTELGVMVGTPAYMSPEQAEASGLDIDTRADIYSLGMVLYELIAGVLPFETRNILPATYLAQYVLGDTDTPMPSHRVDSLGAELVTPVAQLRHTTPAALRRALRGDLDWIVLKAIERDRTRRYETATALASDIERHLQNKPIVARPPTLAYTAAKFVRRHRLAVAVAAGALVALTVMMAGIVRERNRARLASAKAQAISAFLQDMLVSADPWQGGGRTTTIADALTAGLKRLNEGAIRDPLVAASIRRTIGSVYLGLGRVEDADTLVRTALAERIRRAGPESEDAAESHGDLGILYRDQGKFDSAATEIERALAIRRRLHGSNDTLVVRSLIDLSDVVNHQCNRARGDSLATGRFTGAGGVGHRAPGLRRQARSCGGRDGRDGRSGARRRRLPSHRFAGTRGHRHAPRDRIGPEPDHRADHERPRLESHVSGRLPGGDLADAPGRRAGLRPLRPGPSGSRGPPREPEPDLQLSGAPGQLHGVAAPGARHAPQGAARRQPGDRADDLQPRQRGVRQGRLRGGPAAVRGVA
jgi:non-specific serine/threonine protein kinase/serine/threonine-protein kinase